MKQRIINLITLNLLALFAVLSAQAQWTTNRPYRVSDTQLRNVVARIENKTDRFKNQMATALDQSRWNSTNREDDINAMISDFENATDRLRNSIGSTSAYNNEANDVLTRAAYINQFMARNRLNYTVQNQWSSLRTDLNTLARYYNLSWNWNQTLPPYGNTGNYPNVPTYPNNNYPNGRYRPGLNNRLTGTYRLNTSLSDNVSEVVNRSINVYSTTDRPNFGRNLERRLSSPNMLAIERVGRNVTIASSNAPQIAFSADGVARRETNERGRTVTTTVTTAGQGISINYQGDRDNDFYVTFTPVRNDQLRVTRRLYLPNRNQTITVSSVYDRIDTVARWNDVNINNAGGYNGGYNGNVNGNFAIPNGTRITAVLRSMINTRATQVGDRFTMEVTSPNEYRGAIIEGNVSNIDRSGRVSGRANISMDFDTIRMPDGRNYRFEGIVDAVRTANGDTVSVNNEGVVRDSNQTTKTVTRAGIGAALGAIIGAIAGGGQGAAIGAAVGAGAGAGSVLIQGRDNMELGPGTEFSITSSSPGGVGYINR
jgi:hypothetical protein